VETGEIKRDTGMKIRAGFVLLSGWAEHLDEAHDYIARYGLTSDDVSLRRSGEEIYIITKREIELCESPKF
jgi:hypothetical protein